MEQVKKSVQGHRGDLIQLMDELYFGPTHKRDYKQAFALAELLGENGEPIAYRYLAHAYDAGIGVARDKKKAFNTWKKAALLGDAESQAALAHAYARGLGVKRTLKRAIYWDSLAARLGN